MRPRPLGVVVAALAVTSTLLSGCSNPSAPVAENRSTAPDVVPERGEHIAIVLDPGSDIGYVTDEIHSRGMGTVTVPMPSDDSFDEEVAATVRDLRRDPATAEHRVVLLAVGEEATPVWDLLSRPPEGLVAAVTINVPGAPGLDFSQGRSVATLSLNLESDERATQTHHEVHEAMSAAGTLHQVIVYGDVPADGLDRSSPGWAAETAEDVALRTADWLEDRDGFSNQNMENPHH